MSFPTSEELFKTLTDVIYHGGCSDGFVAQLLVKLAAKNPALRFQAISPGGDAKLDEKCVALAVDVLPNPKTHNGAKVYIIDHHKTNEKILADYPRELKIFDMDHSACGLVWQWLYPNTSPPTLVRYVEDRDIWTKKYKETEPFITWLYNQDMTEEEYLKYFDEKTVTEAIEKGRVMERLKTEQIKDACKHANFKIYNNLLYAVVNTTVWKSDVGNKLLELPVDFSVVYSTDSNHVNFSLRSDNKRPDVSEIAEKFECDGRRGGGHRNAAGVKQLLMTELPESKSGYAMYNLMTNIIVAVSAAKGREGFLNHNPICGPKAADIATYAKRILNLTALTIWHETPNGKKSETY